MAAAPRICPAIVGPTAVGKTDLITRLAARLPIEVISLDSRQIYQGLRIGTAQPTAAELAACPHHLVDFVSPREKYDAVRFRRDFERVHREITARGGCPVLVGGAGLYLRALREGFLDIPGQTPGRLGTVRSELDTCTDREIRQKLEEVDPASHARLHERDRYRNQRALEIHVLSGETMTELVARQEPDPALGLVFPAFVLKRPVPQLDARIAARTAAMLEAGWLAETQAAMARHGVDAPGLLSIGYREIVRHLQGELAAEALPDAIVLVTRQYAKRQRTMFRQLPCEGSWAPDQDGLLERLCRLLTKPD